MYIKRERETETEKERKKVPEYLEEPAGRSLPVRWGTRLTSGTLKQDY